MSFQPSSFLNNELSAPNSLAFPSSPPPFLPTLSNPTTSQLTGETPIFKAKIGGAPLPSSPLVPRSSSAASTPLPTTSGKQPRRSRATNVRILWSREQRQTILEVWKLNRYPSRNTRDQLLADLGLENNEVNMHRLNNWFSHERKRYKVKGEKMGKVNDVRNEVEERKEEESENDESEDTEVEKIRLKIARMEVSRTKLDVTIAKFSEAWLDVVNNIQGYNAFLELEKQQLQNKFLNSIDQIVPLGIPSRPLTVSTGIRRPPGFIEDKLVRLNALEDRLAAHIDEDEKKLNACDVEIEKLEKKLKALKSKAAKTVV